MSWNNFQSFSIYLGFDAPHLYPKLSIWKINLNKYTLSITMLSVSYIREADQQNPSQDSFMFFMYSNKVAKGY